MGVEEMAAVYFAVSEFMNIAPEETARLPFIRRIEDLACFPNLHSDSHTHLDLRSPHCPRR